MSLSKITILGPLHPYRGGIAAHTTRLREALQLKREIHTEAYRNPFPKWLYPGEHVGDLKRHPDTLDGAHYDLDYKLPGAWSKVTRRIIAERPEAVLVPWWTFFFAPHIWQLARKLKRENIPLLLICHNLFDHDSSKWKNLLSLQALKHASGFICHSPSIKAELAEQFPAVPRLFYPHPIYDQFTKRDASPTNATTIQLLFFGLVRPYKGLDTLIAALESYPRKAHLTVAGEWWGEQTELLARCKSLKQQGRLTLLNHYIDDQTAEQLFAECHCVVLPYKKATNSGVLAHAIHMSKPAIASDTGAFPYCIKPGETGLLVPPDDVDKLTNAILQIQQMYLDGHDFAPAIENMTASMSWDSFAEKITEFIPLIKTTLPSPS
ncbi:MULTISPECIES: glycosyltransferase family 4 protein [unclassified Lentimonas]|uniref:glycosyltransferase family 4 protein n=1 Tax=unclassified Lentimonas TaxID=2630993 RepID=UPI00132AB0AD|nr:MULTISPECIES: glycosyltransferase [unclassified Lentimonas]CAA6691133.1 Glycosyl transferase, group 1 [Lentimonas sp. CC10]CAA6693762.1 Glycosyl transferase, group 1 [Lentimonas sp. CC19]CAA7070132.1 Glycosyl transferase, group 1 [Lentimonas sp. CC11]